MKSCNVCLQTRPVEDFHARRASPDGLSYTCKSCAKARNGQTYRLKKDKYIERAAEWRKRHPERRKQIVRKYDDANRNAKRKRNQENSRAKYAAMPVDERRAFYRANAKRWRTRNIEKSRDYAKQTRKRAKERDPEKHRARAREATRRRHARKKGGLSKRVDYQAIIIRDQMICYLCGNQIKEAELEFDHIRPVSLGGAHANHNIAASHRLCNRVKHNVLPMEPSLWDRLAVGGCLQ